MLKKITAGVLILSSSVFYLPVYADDLKEPPVSVSTEQTKVPIPDKAEPNIGIDNSSDYLDLKYAKSYVTDPVKIAALPLKWETRDWLKVGLVVGATGSLMLLDQRIKKFSQDNQSTVATKFAAVGNDLGNGVYTLPAVGAFYLYGYLGDDHKARKTALLALESFALSGILTSGLKVLAERHRPNTGDLPTTWDGPHLSLKNVSFSSGHTASAFSIATVFADQYQDHAWVPPLAYGLATLTGLSRIYSNEHWSSDVFVGAALGYFMSKAILKLHQDDNSIAKRIRVLPSLGKEMTGVTMKCDF